ncbi:uncharacterized protein LOC121295168 isoform X2 [Polyodon spathula]|uniref:uncharacterized protein LOC121295168 isoform X2 n=1 Tax=Polyodon spathula TaxID=7913 RepID=UPI001B7F73A4|nr:uncharacterized protein LOC121295168 isoform X2 [Polyodon spathula]
MQICLDEEPLVLQSPEFVYAFKGHSAQIKCSISEASKIDGLYLKRRFAQPQDVLYLSLATMKINTEEYKSRLTHHGECCSFAFNITQLQLNDSDGYYCVWGGLDIATGMLMSYESNGTLIVVKEPRVSCPPDSARSKLNFFLIFVVMSAGAIVVSVVMCVLLWHCTGNKKRYQLNKIPQARLEANSRAPASQPLQVLRPSSKPPGLQPAAPGTETLKQTLRAPASQPLQVLRPSSKPQGSSQPASPGTETLKQTPRAPASRSRY